MSLMKEFFTIDVEALVTDGFLLPEPNVEHCWKISTGFESRNTDGLDDFYDIREVDFILLKELKEKYF